MTGHGSFNSFLHRIGKADSPNCDYCPSEVKTAQDVVENCPKWDQERRTLIWDNSTVGTDLCIDKLVNKILKSKESWAEFFNFCTCIMRKKEMMEREKEKTGR